MFPTCWPWWLQPNIYWPNVRMGINPRNPPWSCQDQDNFVTNRITVITGGAIVAGNRAGVNPMGETHSGTPALMLPEIKIHLHIEPEITVEDEYLMFLESAARHFTENVLRYPIDGTANHSIKQAMLLLIGTWYRNRESNGSEAIREYDMAFSALLSPERDFTVWY